MRKKPKKNALQKKQHLQNPTQISNQKKKVPQMDNTKNYKKFSNSGSNVSVK